MLHLLIDGCIWKWFKKDKRAFKILKIKLSQHIKGKAQHNTQEDPKHEDTCRVAMCVKVFFMHCTSMTAHAH